MTALKLLSRVCAYHLGWDIDDDSTPAFATAYHHGSDLVVEVHRDERGESWTAEVGPAGGATRGEANDPAEALGTALRAFLQAQVGLRDDERQPARRRFVAGLRARTVERALAELVGAAPQHLAAVQ